jgi:hypothetical protein
MGLKQPIDIDLGRAIPDREIQKAYSKGNIKASEASFLIG